MIKGISKIYLLEFIFIALHQPIKSNRCCNKYFYIKWGVIAITFLLLIYSNVASGQAFASWNYTTQTGNLGTTYNWIDCVGGTTVVSGDDATASIAWPFNFSFYDNDYYTTDFLSVTTNGFIRLDGVASTLYYLASGYDLTANSTSLGQIVGLAIYDDNISDVGSWCNYLVTGTSPNRILTIEYRQLEIDYNDNVYTTVQVSFYETSNKVVLKFANENIYLNSVDIGIHSGVDGYFHKWGEINGFTGSRWIEYTPVAIPKIIVNLDNLAFGYQASGSTSGSQNYKISGTNLNGSPIVITAPTGFQVSLDNTNFSTTVSKTYSGTTLPETDIFVRFAPVSVAQNYSANITNSGGGLSVAKTVAVTGTSILNYCAINFSGRVYPIYTVDFNDLNYTGACNTSDCESSYIDETSEVANVEIGQIYSLTTGGMTSGNRQMFYRVYFDWNNDGDFSDVGEYDNIGSSSTGSDVSTTVTIPATASIGLTRMRITKRHNSYTSDACGTFSDRGQAKDFSINITSSNTLQISTTVTNVECNGDNTGAVSVSGTGGQSPYQYKMNSGSYQSAGGFTGLAAGTYTFWLRDNLGAEVSETVSITEPEVLNATITSISPACGSSDGSIVLTGSSGGSGTYEYSINGGANWQSSASFTGLADGVYNIQIRDAASTGCSEILNSSFNLTETGIAIPLLAETTDVDCSSSTNGSIDLKVPFPIQFNDPDYIDIQKTLLSNRSAFTLEGWIKVDLGTIDSRISFMGQNDAIEFGFMSNNSLMCWSASGGSVSTGAYPSDSEWHHIAAVGNGSAIIIYIDGNPVATGGNSTGNYGNNTTYTSKIGAGVWDATGGVFPGQIIKAAFWSTALSSAQISNLASSFYHYTGAETDLLAGYNFYEGSGVVLGSEISGTDGIFNGTPNWQNNYSYSWTKNGSPGFNANTQDLINLAPGTYNVLVTNNEVGCANSDSWLIDITDNEPPVVSNYTADITVVTDAGVCEAQVNYSLPVFSDNCDGTGLSGIRTEGLASGSLFPLGETTVTYEYNDLAGNGPAVCSFTVTVNDTENPEITCPAGVDVGTDFGLCTATGVTLGSPVTYDNCGVANVSNNSIGMYNLGNNTVTWTVTDDSGNTATCTQLVTVTDDEAPEITCPADITVTANSGTCVASGVALGTPVTSDNCGVASVTNNASEPYSMGITNITWTVTDVNGKSATCIQKVTIVPADTIDVQVVGLGDDCQSGETGSTTLIEWNINKISGNNNWTFNYTIYVGATIVDSGTNISVTGTSTQVSFEMDNETAQDKTVNLEIFNVSDNCGSIETNTSNNTDSVTLKGLPDTSDITSN